MLKKLKQFVFIPILIILLSESDHLPSGVWNVYLREDGEIKIIAVDFFKLTNVNCVKRLLWVILANIAHYAASVCLNILSFNMDSIRNSLQFNFDVK